MTSVRPCSCRSAQRSRTSTWWAMSRNVVGSSSSRICVSWASAMASHTRWRWPPDSSSTKRPARSVVFVAARASVTARSSSRDHWRSSRWCGWRPRATRSVTVIPSGAIELCGSRPSRRATCLDGSERMSSPSRRTVPSCGCSIRASARSSVDLPQAFGPTIATNSPSSMRTSSVLDDDVLVVREGDVRARRAAVVGCRSSASSLALGDEQPGQVHAAGQPRHEPHRQLRRHQALRGDVAGQHAAPRP